MTVGFSPKVYVPVLILLVVGLVLVIAGIIADDATLRALGYGALGSALTTLGAGYKATPGEVIQYVGPPSDQHLSQAAVKELNTVH